MPHLHTKRYRVANMEPDVAFNVFASDLLLSFHIFAPYLPTANFTNPLFVPVIITTTDI